MDILLDLDPLKTSITKTLLLNWIYYQPVGHAVEAMAATVAYAAANPVRFL
jgi:hypothetical protein